MSTSVKGVGEIIGGLALTVVAGILNGSWNAAFNPKVALAVGPRSTVQTVQLGRQRTMLVSLRASMSNLKAHREYDLDYHYAWMLFQVYSAIINCVLCIYWAGGPSNVKYVVTHAPASTIVLVVIFSALWGVGMVLYGIACKIAGIGLGTNLVLCIVLMLGTFLPLAYYGGIKSATGGVIMAGLAVVSVGLYFSAASLRIRELDFAKAKRQPTEPASDPVVSNIDEEASNNDNEFSDEPQQNEAQENSKGNNNMSITSTSKISTERSAQDEPEYSVFVKISVCLLAGILSSMLQFAFIFGQDLVDIAENDVTTPLGGSASIIWLFAISIGCIPSICYGFYSSPKEIPLKTIWMCPWWRHLLLICSTSLPWVAQIHLYGLAANVFLPKDFAASIAWPTIMTTTVAQGMTLSLCLGEWKGASAEALSKLRIGLCLTLIGVILFMVSVAV